MAHLNKIVIVGGGSAGWICAAMLSHYFQNGPTQVELVESEEIGTIGVGESTRFLTNHVSWFMRLASPGGYSPEKLLRQVTTATAGSDPNIAGLHVFTFNQVAETEQWRQALLARSRSVPA